MRIGKWFCWFLDPASVDSWYQVAYLQELFALIIESRFSQRYTLSDVNESAHDGASFQFCRYTCFHRLFGLGICFSEARYTLKVSAVILGHNVKAW